jgi:hypothetical protein
MFVLSQSKLSLDPQALQQFLQSNNNKDKTTSYSTMINPKLDLSIKDKFMKAYITLKETRQAHVLMRTREQYLQAFDEVVAASSISPYLAPCSNNPQSK